MNDTFGPPVGDELLRRVVLRLRECVRACVRPTDLVARLGGDEFAIVQADAPQPGATPSLAARSVQAMALAVEIASIPEDIRGYGHVKERHLKTARPKWDALMARWRSGATAHPERAAA